MSKDKFQDKYEEILQELKSDKMDWSFEDFIEKTEKEVPVVPLTKKANPGILKIFWMAAGLVLLIGFTVYLSQINRENTREELVKTEILRQKTSIDEENTFQEPVQVKQDSSQAKKDSAKSGRAPVYQSEEKIINQILPRRSRLRRAVKPRYAENSGWPNENLRMIKDNTVAESEYRPDFVIINGKKIHSEKEAVEATKKALNMFANNVNNTLQEARPVENLTVEF